MTAQILIVTLLTVAIHASDTSSFAVRLAGIRVGKLAVALSLNSIVALVARTSNLVQAPLTGNMIDGAKNSAGTALLADLQTILIGATIGTALAIIASPTVIRTGMRYLQHVDAVGSLAKALRLTKRIELRAPRPWMLRNLAANGVPIRLLALNTFITGAYTVGVLAAQYASYLSPENSTMAASSAGLINGVAIVLMTVFIDPKVALLADRVNVGKAHVAEINRIFGLLMISRLAGTLLAQVLLVPAAKVIVWVCELV